ncbi:MAG: hypothetical protein ABIJ25_07485 [Pseudomonadota bacterium]
MVSCRLSGTETPLLSSSAYATILILSVLIPLFILNRISGKDLASSI